MFSLQKLVINTIPLLGKLTGVGRYTYEVAKRVDATYYYGFFSKKLIVGDTKEKLKNSFIKKIAKKLLSNLPSFKTFDIYFEPNFIPLNIKAKKIITTIHDLSFQNASWHPKDRVEYFEQNFYKNLNRSDKFITVSYFIKNEIIEKLGIKEEKIDVIYNGIDHSIFRKYDNVEIEGLPKKFILFVGSIEPRKNLLRLLKAYHNLKKDYKEEYNLVLVGFQGWKNEEIMKLINKNRDYIKYLGYLDDLNLAKIYNLADIFVYPSLYEGFGIPPIEAMACGCSVLTSDVSSMPEVCQEAAIYCNPFDELDIKNKLEKLIEDKDLRNFLSLKGLSHSKKFNWDKSAREHLKVFNHI